MHALEKILASASGKEKLTTGEIINIAVDLVEINDLYLQVIKSFKKMKGKKVWNPEKVSFVFDHYSPSPTIKAADNHKKMRKFCREQNIEKLFDINQGVCHQVLPEAGLVYPGMVLIATDSHTTTHGALGAFGTGVGATDMAAVLLTGEIWVKVPEIIKIEITGEPKSGVMAKDIILKILGKLGQGAGVYKAVEFTGPVVKNMSMDERMVLCNMAVEMGAQTSYIAPDQKTLNYLEDRVDKKSEIPETDSNFDFHQEYNFDISNLNPQAAVPDSIDNVKDIKDLKEKIKVDQVFIGTCTGGRLNDIKEAAAILGGKKIHKRVRLIVIPASREVYLKALNRGYIETLIKSGATISNPGCGPCLGAHQGVMTAGEVCLTTSSRNFPGRMGSTEAEIYSVSPMTAAVSALKGYLSSGGNN